MSETQNKINLFLTGSAAPAAAALCAMAAVFYGDALFSADVFIARDHYLFFNPRRFFAAESIRSGMLALWNPYNACGVPFLANLQSCVMYPLSAIYYVLPFQTGFKLFIVCHYVLGAFFMFLLSRAWGTGRAASLFSGMVFAFGGYMTSINDNVSFLTAGIWLPLIVLSVHRLVQRPGVTRAAQTAAAVGLQVLAGDVSFCFIAVLLCSLLYLVFCSFQKRGSGRPRPGTVWFFFITAWTAGVALASPVLIPFAEFVQQSHRSAGLEIQQAVRWSMHPAELLQLLIPYVFGSTVPATRWFGQLWLDTVYIGIAPLLLVAFYLLRCRDSMKLYLSSLALLGILLGFGSHTPLYLLLYRLVPAMGMIQYPVKYLFLLHFALAVMAGRGAMQFQNRLKASDNTRRLLKYEVLPALILMAILLVAAACRDELFTVFMKFYPQNRYMLQFHNEMFYEMYKGLFIAAALLGAFSLTTWLSIRSTRPGVAALVMITVITYADLLLVGKPADPHVDAGVVGQPNPTTAFLSRDENLFRVYSLGRTATGRSFMHLYRRDFRKTYRIMQESLVPNTHLYHHICSADEYAALRIRGYSVLFAPVERFFAEDAAAPITPAECCRLLSLLNVKYLVSPHPLDLPSYALEKDGPIKIYKNAGVVPRFVCVSDIRVEKSEDAVVRRLMDPSFDPLRSAVITASEQPLIDLQISPPAGASGGLAWSVSCRDYSASAVTVSVEVDAAALLVFSDTWYPGWKARVDGREVPLLKVNRVMRGVALPAGRHEVCFLYRPASLKAGFAVFAIVFVVMLFCLRGRAGNRALQ